MRRIQALEGLASADGQPSFTFLDNEVVYGRERLRDFREWDWGSRLVAAGIQRLEFERKSEPGRVRQDSCRRSLRADALGHRYEREPADAAAWHPLRRRWSAGSDRARRKRTSRRDAGSDARRRGRDAPMDAGRGAVARRDPTSRGGDGRSLARRWPCTAIGSIVLPLLQLKEFDQYTTTHSLNVAVLAMGLAENLGCTAKRSARIWRGGPAPRHRQDSYSAGSADQAREAHRRRAHDHQPPSGPMARESSCRATKSWISQRLSPTNTTSC